MNIALMSHDNKKELMVQFCTAYAGILSHHNIYATNTTGHMVADATGLNVHCFLSYAHGGSQQIGARIAYNEFDLVLFFNDPNNEAMVGEMCIRDRFWTSSSSPLRSSASSKLSTASTERRRPLLLPRPSPRRRKCCWRRSETYLLYTSTCVRIL